MPTPPLEYFISGQRLNSREHDIWIGIATSHTTNQIAADLGISPKTVEFHRLRLMNKLGCHDYAALTRAAIRAGLIQP